MNYEINCGTLAILPKGNDSLIYEDESTFVVNQTPFKIMEDGCKYFGSSYEGRKEGAKSILGSEYKLPIIVEDRLNLVVFPTTSPSSDDCIWLFLNRIKNFTRAENNCSKIIFDNGVTIDVPVSFRSLENQVSKSSRLDLIMRNRKIK